MPPSRQRNIRKRKQEGGSDEEDAEEDPATIRERLETAKLLQRQRARPSGLDTTSLAVQRDDLPEAATGMAAKPGTDIMDSFSKEQAKDTLELDPDMQKYVEEQMEKRMGIKKQSDDRKKLHDPEAELYVTPDELKIEPIKPAEVPGSWLTGITEVQLPAHYKLKNIEETEAAKKRMLQPDDASDEEEEAFARQQAEQGVLPRGAFPRGFGREVDKVAEVRKLNLLRKTQRPESAGRRSRPR